MEARQRSREEGYTRANIGFNSRAELEANIKGRPERRRREDRKRRERIRQQARRRAAGSQSRALRSLRRPTPDAPHLRPARRNKPNRRKTQAEYYADKRKAQQIRRRRAQSRTYREKRDLD